MDIMELSIYFLKILYIKCCILSQKIKIAKLPNLPKKTNKRVLFIPSDNNKSSGAFLCLVSLCDFLMNKYGLDIFVLLPHNGDGKSLLDAKSIPNCVMHSFGWGIELSRVRDNRCEKEIDGKKQVNNGVIAEICKFIRNNEVDLVHINTSYTYIGAIAAIKENIPFVWHIRELLEEGQDNTMWNREKGNKLINKSDKVIAISDSVYEKYSEFIDVDRLTTIYDGIEVDNFYNPNKEIFKDEVVKIIFVGNIAEYKGIYDFCDACIELHNTFKNIEIHIVGSGKNAVVDEIKNRFDNAGMNNKINFFGYQKNVGKFLNNTDIFCMCTRWEAFGRTTVEAMLSGNLVIGADSAGTKDLIDDKVTGILYSQGNSSDLSEKMSWAIQNKTKSKEIATCGRRYMFENMSAERNADEIYELYDEILN